MTSVPIPTRPGTSEGRFVPLSSTFPMSSSPADFSFAPSSPSSPLFALKNAQRSPTQSLAKRAEKTVFVQESTFLQGTQEKLVVVMVGMPARGKSSISTKLRRYLTWLGYKVQVFNVGNRRREVAKEKGLAQDSTFFDSDPERVRCRDEISLSVLEDLLVWLKGEGHVAIHDATNSTKDRRKKIIERIKRENGVNALFIESICTDQEMIKANIQLKFSSPDYKHLEREVALKDFMERLENYERRYQMLGGAEEESYSYLQLINVGQQVMLNHISGYLESQIVMFLMNYHVRPRSIWVTRHGESMANVEELLGGDYSLSPLGQRFAAALAKFVTLKKDLQKAPIWTSNLIRTQETVALLKEEHPMRVVSALNEIYAGVCEGMTYQQIAQEMPEEFKARQRDKLRYRYPGGGESYLDLIQRLQPVIIDLERKRESVLVVGHQAVLRAVIGFFIGVKIYELPYVAVPLHVVTRLIPTAFGCEEIRYAIDIERFENGEEKFWTKEKRFYSLV